MLRQQLLKVKLKEWLRIAYVINMNVMTDALHVNNGTNVKKIKFAQS